MQCNVTMHSNAMKRIRIQNSLQFVVTHPSKWRSYIQTPHYAETHFNTMLQNGIQCLTQVGKGAKITKYDTMLQNGHKMEHSVI